MLGSKIPHRMLEVFHRSSLIMSADLALPSEFDSPWIGNNFWVYTESDVDLTVFVVCRIK